MSKVHIENESVWFWCPGCDMPHRIVTGDNGWQFNRDSEKPTITPSVLVRGKTSPTCHSFITDGNIEFLGDCTHEMANQTVQLPEWVMDL